MKLKDKAKKFSQNLSLFTSDNNWTLSTLDPEQDEYIRDYFGTSHSQAKLCAFLNAHTTLNACPYFTILKEVYAWGPLRTKRDYRKRKNETLDGITTKVIRHFGAIDVLYNNILYLIDWLISIGLHVYLKENPDLNKYLRVKRHSHQFPDINCERPFIRLVDGKNNNEGRVEIYYSGAWGAVCDDSWDNNDAKVVCRMLDHSTTGAESTNGAIFGGNAHLETFLDEARCLGNESSIHICDHRWWKEHDCIHSEDAGVRCDVFRE
ncbi:hypothetical protein CHS0354_000208 [Potamilus streckersoni]|uniref:SRCR domain-containing protein n=1 Tax=Potamilus streckersoni TaxID=2493646 RepID=A0AAE0RQK5_9BIVA|nr:hypothetical protein CHS0354_000208 [Potamilus streckersoni]